MNDPAAKIREALETFAQKYDTRVIFVAESGSRAWGFASSDSDYDVRFIYASPSKKYLSLEKWRDTHEWFTDEGLFDYAGWDLRKALQLFASCNPTLNEQLQSPIVYLADEDFLQNIRKFLPLYFQQKKSMFHYLGIASHLREQVEKERKIGIKKIFYVIRPLLACEWIANRNSMPPTEFQKIFENTSIPNSARKETERLLEYKKTVKEGEEIELNNDFVSWLIDLYERNTTIAKSLESIPVHGWEPLNNLFLEQIGFSEFFNRD